MFQSIIDLVQSITGQKHPSAPQHHPSYLNQQPSHLIPVAQAQHPVALPIYLQPQAAHAQVNPQAGQVNPQVTVSPMNLGNILHSQIPQMSYLNHTPITPSYLNRAAASLPSMQHQAMRPQIPMSYLNRSYLNNR